LLDTTASSLARNALRLALLAALVIAIPLLGGCGADEGEIIMPAAPPPAPEEAEEAVEATAEPEAESLPPTYPANVDSNPETMGYVYDWWTAQGGSPDAAEFEADYPRIWEQWVAAGSPET
jgi:hypothetical protein